MGNPLYQSVASALFFLIPLFSAGQLGDFGKEWISLGPNEKPLNPRSSSDAGIGPIEFVRVNQKKEGLLLAGSLSGGLFYSKNGGGNWENSGSDNWHYTGCAWADFHPENEDVWFACSNRSGDNGKPGKIGEKGGLLRTINGGENWYVIGNFKDFGGSPRLKIYGTRFHPNNPNFMYVLTSDGLYFSENCMESGVKWKKVPNLQGWVYDLDFIGDETMYVSNFFHGKWNILQFEENDLSKFKKIKPFEEESRPMRNVTMEAISGRLVIAKDFTSGADELWSYYPESDSISIFLARQNISFGSGHTFTVSPHDTTEFFIGYGTRIKRWAAPYDRAMKVGSGYHVDIEYIAYDPFDSLKIYFATHGGVFISEDNGKSWNNKSDNLGVAEVMGLAVSESNPNEVAIGCYHDGSMVLADFDHTGNYYWQHVNGGDGLIPLIHPTVSGTIYTSNQFSGGGLYYSDDTVKNVKRNIHSLNSLKTSGWEMAAVLNHKNPSTVYFNFMERKGVNEGNINVCRTSNALERKSVEVLSNFFESHKMKKYKVYGLYNSPHHPDVLIAYVLDYVKDDNGKKKTNHRLFRCDRINAPAEEVVNSWYELEHPNNYWVGDVEIDGYNAQRIFVSYIRGKENPETMFGDKGLIYALKYRNDLRHSLKREIDISKNIPNTVAGRHNLAYTKLGGGILFMATRTGVYYARSRVLRGRSRWVRVGQKLPHCKVYGLDFNEDQRILTLGLFGRGVWQYRFR